MKYSHTIAGLVLMLVICSCSTQLISIDFTEEGGFTDGIEGPATDHLGNIYAVNYKEQGTIGKVTPEGKAEVYLKLPNGSIGNGIRFGKEGQMFIADYTNHNILMVNPSNNKVEVYAHQPAANQPNDIAIAPDFTIYASDPNWSVGTGNLWKISRDQGFELLEADMGTTNGIEVSPDGQKLYVNESVQRKIWVYDILDDGSVANKKEFFTFSEFGLDGMRCDADGNLYVCRFGKGTIVKLSPDGVLLEEIQLKGKKPTNITFGPQYKQCYITVADRGCIEMIKL